MNTGIHTLNDNERTRYLRQIAIDGFGEAAQRSLKASTVTVIGMGGLGSPASMYLAAAGVGRMIVVDYQSHELSNLNRQVLHWEKDVKNGAMKVVSAAKKLCELNSKRFEIIPKVAKIGVDNLCDVVEDSAVIVDCLDNFDARKMLNIHCVKERVPFVHAAVEGLSGQSRSLSRERRLASIVCSLGLQPENLSSRSLASLPGSSAVWRLLRRSS